MNFRRRVDRVQGLEGIQDSILDTPKECMLISHTAKEVPIPKNEMSSNLTSEDETKIIS
jgi:hypothetical protein